MRQTTVWTMPNVDQYHKLGFVLNYHVDAYLREHPSLSDMIFILDVTNLTYGMIHPVML